MWQNSRITLVELLPLSLLPLKRKLNLQLKIRDLALPQWRDLNQLLTQLQLAAAFLLLRSPRKPPRKAMLTSQRYKGAGQISES
jgi:hypothetical protein